jgi:(p)ppGpp synthase/HD superfamily hydrolase
MNIVERAKEFAIKAHSTQKYGKMPYEYHLQQVVSKLTHWRDLGQWEITDECLTVAWLHDVIEDTDMTEQDIIDNFGDSIAYQVIRLSKLGGTDYDFYIECVKSLRIAKLVKMADTLCNLEASILSGEMKRINKYSKQLALLTEV